MASVYPLYDVVTASTRSSPPSFPSLPEVVHSVQCLPVVPRCDCVNSVFAPLVPFLLIVSTATGRRAPVTLPAPFLAWPSTATQHHVEAFRGQPAGSSPLPGICNMQAAERGCFCSRPRHVQVGRCSAAVAAVRAQGAGRHLCHGSLAALPRRKSLRFYATPLSPGNPHAALPGAQRPGSGEVRVEFVERHRCGHYGAHVRSQHRPSGCPTTLWHGLQSRFSSGRVSEQNSAHRGPHYDLTQRDST